MSDADTDALTVAPLSIPLRATPAGPELAPDEPALEAFGWVLNEAVKDDQRGRGLFDAIVNGGYWGGNEIGVEQVGPDHDVAPQIAAWRRLTGADPKPPLTAFAMGFLPAASVVPREFAAEVAIRLRDLRRKRAMQPPWLFRRDPPVWDMAHPSERSFVEHLDRRARDIDERAASAGDWEPPDLLADRRELLADLDAAGLLSAEQAGAKRHLLRYWALGTLMSWYDAACEANQYLVSGERKRYIPDATGQAVWGSPVTLDLFRDGLICPRGVQLYEWVSFGEFLLNVDPLPDDSQGKFLHHDEDGWVRLRWRRDYGDQASLRMIALS